MTRQEFLNHFGEAPEDILGQDWENELANYQEELKDKDEIK